MMILIKFITTKNCLLYYNNILKIPILCCMLDMSVCARVVIVAGKNVLVCNPLVLLLCINNLFSSVIMLLSFSLCLG
jgi:hypothetical protein